MANEYTAKITATDNDSCLSARGSCDATIYLDGREVGEVTLLRDESGEYSTHGTAWDYWASEAMIEHLQSFSEDWLRNIEIAEIIHSVNKED